MHVQRLMCLTGGAALVAGADLAGFQIAIDPTLLVVYGSTTATGGVVVAQAATAQEPLLAVPSAVTASSLAIMMVDLDIPSSTQPTTFLHWIQTDLVASTSIETIMTSQGNVQGFGVNLAKNTTAIVPYTQPNPPAQAPLSHRYTELLLDTSSLTTAGLAALQAAAQNRVNFNINTTLEQAGLSKSVIAWNFFNVTNSASTDTATNTNANAGGNSTAGSGSKGKGSKKGKAGDGTASVASNTNSTAGSTDSGNGKKGGKKGKGGDASANAATNSTSTTGSNDSGNGNKGGKKGKNGNGASNSTSAAGSTASSTGNGGKKGKGGKGSNSTSTSSPAASSVSTGNRGGSGATNISAGAVNSNSSVPGTVTTSGSPDRWALHSVLLSLSLVGAAFLAL